MGETWLAMGLIPLISGAWLVARYGCRAEPGSPRTLAAAVIAWAWVTVGMELLGNLGHLDRPWLVGWSVSGFLLAAVVAFLRRSPGATEPETRGEAAPLGLAATCATALVVWVGLRIGLVSFFQPVKVVSDGPIYHLYMAARWWQAGHLFLVATPFGEVGATYFWANGELWFAWLMTLFGGDRYARLGQVPFLALSGLAVGAIARHLRVGAPAARIAAAWFVTVSPLFLYGFEPNVDSILVAGYLMAAYFFLRAFTTLGFDLRFLVLGSLAAGLGMGTKPTGIVFFPPLLAVAVGLVGWRGGWNWRRTLAGLAAVLVPAVAMMGYWPIRNAWLTGNLLYPIHLEAFGRIWLAGWFGPGAMAQSQFYIPRASWQLLIDIMMAVLDPREFPLWVAAVAGLWGVRRARPVDPLDDRPTLDRWVWGFTALAVFNLAAYWVVIPYRTQQRFAYPAVALASVALAKLLDRAGWLRGLAVVLLTLHLTTPQPWPIAATETAIPWDFSPGLPNLVPALLDLPLTSSALLRQLRRPGLWATVALGLGAFGVVGIAGRGRGGASRRLWGWRAAAAAWLAPFVVAGSWWVGAGTPLPFPYFADYYAGWIALEMRAGPQGAKVAYAGNKIPYYLLGSKLQNDVRYVNIDAHRDWLLHDYHRHAPEAGEPSTWPNPYPVWDRLRPDYSAWLSNLRAAGIEFLVVMRVNPSEGRENVADRERFPVERGWADAHPEVFRPVHGVVERDPWIKVYQVLPPS